jgi:tetratricopeptide (TPR) repeat protein/transcriptional regulator with XRE-family HTH domain
VFGKLLATQRRRLGLTQEELAGRSGLAVRSIRNIETGRRVPRLSSVRLLADALGLDGFERERFCFEAQEPPATRTESPRQDGRPIPAQLPSGTVSFTGRHALIADLDGLLAWTPRPVAALIGTAGVGKTTVAVHWASRVAQRFPDGQLYADLHGFHPAAAPTHPAEVLRGFLVALGVQSQRIPDDLAAQAALYRSLLAGTQTLIVLDDARDTEQVLPLLPGAPGSMVVVTSRAQLTGLVAAGKSHPVPVDLLPQDDARALLAARLGSVRIEAEPAAAQKIIERCARLPLALAIVAARAALPPTPSLAVVADELRDDRGRLDPFEVGDASMDLRTAFHTSYRALQPAAARLFRLLGRHAAPDLTVPAAASLAGCPMGAARRLVGQLTRAHLLVEHRPGRYTIHDLLHAYAGELPCEPGDQQASIRRLVDYYLHNTHAAAHAFEPHRYEPALPEPERHTVLLWPADTREAREWYAGEQRNALAAVDEAAAAGLDGRAWMLAECLSFHLDRQGLWRTTAGALRTGLAAAERSGDVLGEALCQRALGRVYTSFGRGAEAHEALRRAHDLFETLGDDRGQAAVDLDRCRTHEGQGEHAEALSYAWRALIRFQATDDARGQAEAHNSIGWFSALGGDPADAIAHCEPAVSIFRKISDRRGEADALDSIGYAYYRLADYETAEVYLANAGALYRDLGAEIELANTLDRSADNYRAAGNYDEALAAWQEGLTILTELDHPGAGRIQAKLTDMRRRRNPAR